MPDIPEGMTELVDADIPRMDLVDKGANGRGRWLLMKNAGDSKSLAAPDLVAALIKEAQEEPGMPDNIDDVEKDADLNAGGDPLVGGNSPDASGNPGSAAWEQVDSDTATKWIGILARAKNAVTALAEREAVEGAAGESDGDDNVWDLEDACDAIDYAMGLLARYAASEQADADLSDLEKSAIDSIAEVVKGLEEAPVSKVEGFGAVVKAGRVLSAANEAALRDAAALVEKVLSSLPTAPVAEEEDVEKTEEPAVEKSLHDAIDEALETEVEKTELVEDEAIMKARADYPLKFHPNPRVAARGFAAETILKEAGIDPETVVKDDAADGGDEDPQKQAVFDANGKLIGVVDPADIELVTGTEKEPAEPEKPAAAAPAAPAAAPAAAAAPAVPAVKTATQEDETESDAKLMLTKADLEAFVNERVEAAVAEVRGEVDALRKPATPAVYKYGRSFPQDDRHQAADADVTKGSGGMSEEDVQAAKAALLTADSPADREAAKTDLNKAAAEALKALRQGAPVIPLPPRR